MDKHSGSRVNHQTILRKLSTCESEESGCKSADEDDEDEKSNPHTSLIIETSTKTVMGESSGEFQHSSTNSEPDFTPNDPIHRRSESIPSRLCSKLPSTRRHRIRSCCPSSDEKLNVPASAKSTNSLSPRLLGARITGDSGTGISMTNLPNQASSAILFDERIIIYGLEGMASMPNRLLFDPSKVHAHDLRRNVVHANPSNSPDGLYNSHAKKSLSGILSSFFGTKKPSTASSSPPVTPMVRHHNSRFYSDTEHQ